MKLILRFCIITIVLFSCDDDSGKSKCPPYDIVLESPYNDPVWHPSGLFIGFNHKPIKEIHYRNGYDCPHQAVYKYNNDSAGFWLINSDGTNQRRILPYTLTTPAWSPDGKWMAFSKGAQICILPFDGIQFDTAAIVPLTTEGRNFFPAWSPDGKWIAYDSDQNSPTGLKFIWKMRKSGLSKMRIAFTPNEGETRMPWWGEDYTIVHQRYIGKGSPEIFRMDSTGNNVVRLTENNIMEMYPKYSPINESISYISYSGMELWIINVTTNSSTLLTNGGCLSYSWSSEGKIVYLNFDNSRIDETRGTLWTMDSDGNNKCQLTYNNFQII
jgi:Tol biopolymer transport system component